MPYVKGLQVLNVCEENQKMLQKLRLDNLTLESLCLEAVVTVVRNTLVSKSSQIFVADDSEIACNPVSSFQALKHTE